MNLKTPATSNTIVGIEACEKQKHEVGDKDCHEHVSREKSREPRARDRIGVTHLNFEGIDFVAFAKQEERGLGSTDDGKLRRFVEQDLSLHGRIAINRVGPSMNLEQPLLAQKHVETLNRPVVFGVDDDLQKAHTNKSDSAHEDRSRHRDEQRIKNGSKRFAIPRN